MCEFIADRVKRVPPWPIATGLSNPKSPPVDVDKRDAYFEARKPQEWSEQSKYNSFNSYKYLTYYEKYKSIVAWMNGNDYLPPPIEVNLDPIAKCNLDCYFCITQRYLKHHYEEVGKMTELPLDYMLNLVDFLVEWGVKGLCISGGGEPTLHKDLPELVTYAAKKMDVAVVTNATKPIGSLLPCRWVALSVDASNRDTYKAIKGVDKFDLVIGNIKRGADARRYINPYVDLCFKLLVLPENQYEIYDACLLAKSLGVQDFHVRPVDFERKDIEGAKKLDLDIPSIYEQFRKCHLEETDDFRVFTVMHKFDSRFHVKHGYKSCLASPVILPILTDGNAYICVEHKMQKKYRLGSCYPPEEILNWWGGDKHRQVIKGINPKRDCSRCVYSECNRQIEECVIEDKLCVNFS